MYRFAGNGFLFDLLKSFPPSFPRPVERMIELSGFSSSFVLFSYFSFPECVIALRWRKENVLTHLLKEQNFSDRPWIGKKLRTHRKIGAVFFFFKFWRVFFCPLFSRPISVHPIPLSYPKTQRNPWMELQKWEREWERKQDFEWGEETVSLVGWPALEFRKRIRCSSGGTFGRGSIKKREREGKISPKFKLFLSFWGLRKFPLFPFCPPWSTVKSTKLKQAPIVPSC